MLAEVADRLINAKTVVIDVETDGLDWRNNHIVGYVFTFGPLSRDTYYLPVRHETGNNLDPAKVRAMIVAHQNTPRHWVGHNLAFDLAFFTKEGITLNGTFEDTMVNECLLNEFEQSYSLEACADRSGVQAKKASEILNHIASVFGGEPSKNRMGEFWRLDAEDTHAVEYATGDGTSTWQLWEVQQNRLNIQDLRRVWAVECALIPVLNRMTMRGIRVDVDRLHRVKERIEKDLMSYRSFIDTDGLNVNSSKQMAAFFTKHGITNWPVTEKGNPSFAEEWLMTTELGRKFVRVKQYDKILSAFINPMLERHLYKGRVHSQFNQLKSDEYGTVTGRLSSSNPNLQQVPKRNVELGVMFRSIFIPDDGLVWGSSDYSQCEPRLLAYYSGCRVLIEGYNAQPPVDAHTSVAQSAGIDRQSGKRLNQALLTGAGIKKATAMLGKPPAEAQEIVDRYFAAMPEIRDLQHAAANIMKSRKYVKSILGRRARLEGPGYEYKAVNRLLQCSNADMIKQSMVRIDEYCRSVGGIDMINNVHDSIDFQYEPGKRHAYDESLKIMCDFPMIDVVPIEVEEDSGDNWSIASYGEKDYMKVMTEKGLL